MWDGFPLPGIGSLPLFEDPAVAAVEGLFGVSRRCEVDPEQRVEAAFALWVGTCYSDDDFAPTWLVYERAADGNRLVEL